MDYKASGVDVEAGRSFVQRIKTIVGSTRRPEVLGDFGSFGGLFRLGTYEDPVLVAGTDGVGTKLKLAHLLDRHETVGIDLVAMCVNDVLTSGAEPLFFLDYLATGYLEPDQLAAVVEGVATGCRRANCALLGGETAEMPGFYTQGEYDMAGFCVGVVERSQIIDGSRIEVGDYALALASSGVHSNGYSLVRKVIEVGNWNWSDRPQGLEGQSLGDCFLTPTEIYVQPILAALEVGIEIRGMAHITGGGLPENLPRCLGAGQSVRVDGQSWTVPPVFRWLAEVGDISDRDCFHTFNMGVGFVAIVSPAQAEKALRFFDQVGCQPWILGEVVEGTGEVLGLPA
ncbi:MAG: phosphoribosylformylglycinamidine cyclo-ligase [Prochlorotrichaceae cyanobacterium]|jgi:phosphoribosylformylglycinamidine cyclo-ligase